MHEVYTLTKLYYDGDSFSCSLPHDQTVTTGHVLAHQLNYRLDHYGHNGKTVDKIVRNSMRYSWENTDCYMCIGVGVVNRLEAHDANPDAVYPYKNYTQEHCVKTVKVEDVDRENIEMFNDQYLQITTLYKLIALHDYLLYNKHKFVIHNLGYNYFGKDGDDISSFAFAQGVQQQVENRPRLLNFFENSFHQLCKQHNLKPWDYDQYGWNGHPDELGHSMYADYLLEKIKHYE